MTRREFIGARADFASVARTLSGSRGEPDKARPTNPRLLAARDGDAAVGRDDANRRPAGAERRIERPVAPAGQASLHGDREVDEKGTVDGSGLQPRGVIRWQRHAHATIARLDV